jgi:L-alanine-DL-glutamate epimerase-like enolase superfamily enzyme
LNGSRKPLETDLTIGIDEPEKMAETAVEFKNKGVRIIKVKLGKDGESDIRRVRQIRNAVGDSIQIRIDANQGWDFETASEVLVSIGDCKVSFCEQPMRFWNDHRLPELRKISPVKIMADESVFNHHDAKRLIKAGACDYVNIKFAKTGGFAEAFRVNQVCENEGIACMMGGMLESRLALTAFAHFAISQNNVQFYDMDTCLLGHKTDPVLGGVQYRGYFLEVPDAPGIGADMDEKFLRECEQVRV